jgi:hypothetical protein
MFVTLDLTSSSIFAALWPVAVGLSLWAVRYTTGRSPQSYTSEQVWITAGLLLQMITLWLGASLEEVITAVTTRESLLSVVFVPTTTSLLTLIVATVPHIERYERQFDDVRQYSFVAVLLIVGILAAGSFPFVPDRYRPVAIGFATLGLILAPLILVVRYYDI